MNFSILDGKKTYIIVAIVVLGSVLENLLGWDIPGFTADPNWFVNALTALGVGTLRAGIASDTSK